MSLTFAAFFDEAPHTGGGVAKIDPDFDVIHAECWCGAEWLRREVGGLLTGDDIGDLLRPHRS